MNYRIRYSRDHLAHHGILGQKWGVRNGPPYPLGKSDYSAAEKKAETSKRKLALTEGQKRAIKIGAAVAVAGLAVYGGYKLSQISDTNVISATISGIDQAYVNRIPTKIVEPETKTLTEVNGHLANKPGNEHACVSSSFAGFLRSNRYNVRAVNIPESMAPSTAQEYEDLVNQCFKNARTYLPKDAKSFVKDPDGLLTRRFGNNAEGVLSVVWKNGSPLTRLTGDDTNGGHSFNFKIVNGQVKFTDFKVAKLDYVIRMLYLSQIEPNGEFFAADLSNAEPIWDSVLSDYLEIM